MQALKETNFHFPQQTGFYRGKVRDVYYFQDKLALVATDRISAFDVVLPRAIPYKGQVLNQIAASFLEATASVVPNWVLRHPAPNVTIGRQCETFKVEMVIRGYLAGHAWREYSAGKRTLCGVPMPNGLQENDPFPEPIITPTTKAAEGHDEDISREEILRQGIVSEEDYLQLEAYTRALFQKGSELAAERGLILVDTKYEFGKADGILYVIDEIHTPDSSRFFYSEGYEERQKNQQPQRQLSKEFVRQWLIENGFQGKDGQQVPEMTDAKVTEISQRYIELYEQLLGKKFSPQDYASQPHTLQETIAANIF
ncbi:phosphoribosylaminoimidazolesuccinocarboxamide synthase [Rufibacter glacialis]|uniref:Phosphoribosylaminoimidazole-succinocarboxamide synthase n=1 Tax=Rufibacter glacialis TaxID=1259555 RepID=A0A5M8Q704_9BACT|nr:phosphoribosylaminoimidazolesuccinocarboxamide synthase [Rufibacter glacialis]KAA6431667.1 phosphoribosylaminoimidazolesuccinocarboxamide synthase [Rufibacter glacialis]GGK82576.1 phosphoribosylaminoimidazole-succinocarboxamide synthase [Rufibacter glacialis]